jgi:hypothetical protein
MKPIPRCPYLGSAADPQQSQALPDASHRCYAQKPPTPIDSAHQRNYCLTGSYWNCAAYIHVEPLPALPEAAAAGRGRRTRRVAPLLRALPWVVLGLVLLAVVVTYGRSLLQPPPPVTESARAVSPVTSAPPAPTATASPSPFVAQKAALPSATRAATPSREPGGSILTLAPEVGGSGWWASGDALAEHLDDSYLYAGYFNGRATISAGRFDLRRVRRGAPILDARLVLTGLSSERLNPSAGGLWTVQLLDPVSAPDLPAADFQAVYNAPAAVTLFPTLYPADLEAGMQTAFVLDAEARQWLAQQALDGVEGIVFRIVGPGGGEDTLFAWDSGTGPSTRGNRPELVLSLGAPPETPPPLATLPMIVATLTPTPANVLTAAADAWTATAIAMAIGTYTPLPYGVATPTPEAENIATAQARAYALGLPPPVVYTATPANAATATADALNATAVAVTTGTFTPVPTGAVTPIIVMPTPLPRNAATAVAQLLQVTAQAGQLGTATALPPGAVVATRTPEPPVVASTYTPANAATRAIQAAEATLAALTTGGYTPVPPNARTPTPFPTDRPAPPATALPLLVPITPRPGPSPTPAAPGGLPAALRGKILFRSDRDGSEQLYALDPANGRLMWVTQGWPFTLAQAREGRSPDGRNTAEVQTVTDVTAWDIHGNPAATQSTAVIFVRSGEYQTSRELTTRDRFSYDPAWSPAGEQIAFVARGENDEIYAVNADGSNLRRLTKNTWEWDKHPSWSPDGKQIVFWSNRDTGRRQLWVMNADGSNQRRLLSSAYNDWDPIWVK